MLSIMHDHHGIQCFYTAQSVMRVGPFSGDGKTDMGPERLDLFFSLSTSERQSLYGGTVYVMNEAGATIGKYNLPEHLVSGGTPAAVPQ